MRKNPAKRYAPQDLPDFFATLEYEVEILFNAAPEISGLVLDPCCGSGTEARVARRRGMNVLTNDIDRRWKANSHKDATSADFWNSLPTVDWVVCNPPFNQAGKIVPLAYEHVREGVAFYLRLLWLQTRRGWFSTHALSHLIVLPNASYIEKGTKDPIVRCWFVWPKNYRGKTRITFASRPR